jgi:cytochrome o ubiquinol oxidase subunit 1
MPLYALGLMGAVRRIDHYDDPSWKPFFIVSAIGVVVIGIGIALFVAQLVYSIWKRKELRDKTGDPWNGRTLEWSVPSPAPFYNFAVTPKVSRIDEWWYQKQEGIRKLKRSEYEDITLPKNSSLGIVLGLTVGVIGFALIWHIWWLALAALIATVGVIIYRGMQDDVEYTVTAEQLYVYEKEARS